MEKTLWTQIRKKLKNFFIQRVETQIERGIPDVHYVTYGGHCGWIEGKWVKTPKRRKTKIKRNNRCICWKSCARGGVICK